MKEKLIIGLLSIIAVALIAIFFVNLNGKTVVNSGAAQQYPYSEGYTNFDNLNANTSFRVNGTTQINSYGTFADGTTTAVSVKNPFGSTSSIEMFQFIIPQSGVATGTVSWACGTSTTAYGSPSATLVTNVSVATSTAGIISNAISLGSGFFVNTSSQGKIGVGPNEYINCLGTVAGPGNPLTDVGEQFTGTYKIRWIQ